MLWWNVRKLRSKDPAAREGAAVKLGASKDRRAAKPLLTALGDMHWRVQAAAVEALGRIGDVETLIAALNDDNANIRRGAVVALGRIADPRAVGPLVAAIADGDRGVRIAAEEALNRIDAKWDASKAGRRAAPALVRAIAARKGSMYGLIEAAIALCRIDPDWRKSDAAKAIVPEVFYGLCDRYEREAAAKALDLIDPGWTESEVAKRYIRNLVRDLPADMAHAAAAQLLERIDPNWAKSEGAREAVPDLVEALEGRDKDERIHAAEALGKIGDSRGIEPLAAALRKPKLPLYGRADERTVHKVVVEALGRIGDSRVVELLLAALEDRDGDVRVAAVRALGQIGDSRAVEPLVAAHAVQGAQVRAAAAEVLDKLAPGWRESGATKQAAPADLKSILAELMDRDASKRERAQAALEQIDPNWRESDAAKQVVPQFVAALEDLDLYVRNAAVSALKAMRWQPRDQRECELFERESEIAGFMVSRGLSKD